jgi:hypothetical protein
MKLVDTEENTTCEITKELDDIPNVDYWLDMLEGALRGMGYADYEFIIKDDPDDENNYDNVDETTEAFEKEFQTKKKKK